MISCFILFYCCVYIIVQTFISSQNHPGIPAYSVSTRSFLFPVLITERTAFLQSFQIGERIVTLFRDQRGQNHGAAPVMI